MFMIMMSLVYNLGIVTAIVGGQLINSSQQLNKIFNFILSLFQHNGLADITWAYCLQDKVPLLC